MVHERKQMSCPASKQSDNDRGSDASRSIPSLKIFFVLCHFCHGTSAVLEPSKVGFWARSEQVFIVVQHNSENHDVVERLARLATCLA